MRILLGSVWRSTTRYILILIQAQKVNLEVHGINYIAMFPSLIKISQELGLVHIPGECVVKDHQLVFLVNGHGQQVTVILYTPSTQLTTGQQHILRV